MINITGSTLFIVGSPFQCLCMLEAINHWQISDYDVIVNGMTVNEPMITLLLSEKGIKFEIQRRNHLLKEVLPLLFSKHKRYNNVFIGNYYNLAHPDMALAYCKSKAKVICMDDGTQVLELFSDHPRKVRNKVWVSIIQLLFSMYAAIKRINTSMFYTIYDVKSTKYLIEKNSFDTLDASKTQTSSGVYIIGTNSSKLVLKDQKYTELLQKTVNHCKKEYPDQDVHYCPHRGDINNSELKPLMADLNVMWFETKISVEYDFVKDGIYPTEIVGFNSNALFTLHSLFPKSKVSNIVFQLKDKEDDIENSIIRDRLKNYGIRTIME